jgi:LysM repeat protein
MKKSSWITTILILIALITVFVLVIFTRDDEIESGTLHYSQEVTEGTENQESEEELVDDNEPSNEEEEPASSEENYGEVEAGSTEYVIQAGDSLGNIATEFGVTIQELQWWNGIFNPSALNEGATLIVDGPNEQQAQKEEWQWVFEQELFDTYGVTVSEYEDLGDGIYGVYVAEFGTQGDPYVTVDSQTGEITE